MVSYEKLRKNLRQWTIFIGVINILGVIGKVLSIVGVIITRNNLDTYKANTSISEESYQLLVASSNISVLILAAVALIANVVIAVLAFQNLSKIKTDTPSQLPYLAGIIYTIVYNVANIALSWALGISFSVAIVIYPLLFLALYAYVYGRADKLLNKDTETLTD